MKGIIYTRVSSNEQVHGTSLEDQDQKCKRYCLDHGIEVLKIFREEGESAKTSDRSEFLRALEYCRKNKGNIDAFVVIMSLILETKKTSLDEWSLLVTPLRGFQNFIRIESILKKQLFSYKIMIF